MFCNQCEQAAKSVACVDKGVCGKEPDVAALQDLLIHTLKGISFWADKARSAEVADTDIDRFVIDSLFSTVTNVDFSAESVAERARVAMAMRDRAAALFDSSGGATFDGRIPEPAAPWTLGDSTTEMAAFGTTISMGDALLSPDIESARAILLNGLRGYAAYAYHARTLGSESAEIYAFTHKALAASLDDELELDELMTLALECGRINLVTMELLSRANTGRYGHPSPATVSTGTRAGKAILVSGHDLPMLQAILDQTQGKGVDVYTHGEMLPAHGYPELRKYEHLAGNFGGAWQDQARDFADFSGAIILNTNCIQRPTESYAGRLFTWGLVQWPGTMHIEGWDFSPVIEKALASQALAATTGREMTVGFGHEAVLGHAETIIEAVKTGAIRHFFLVGGCDGARPGRNYYTEFVEKTPADTIVMTLACGKYRFNQLDLGDIGGIPRLLDIGQCNDAYSAIRIAVALSEAFECGVNDLPLSLVLSWYEQKAVAILLTLLHLGIKNIKIGPSLPAFISEGILSQLVEGFNIAPITTAEADLAELIGDETLVTA